MYVKDFYFDLPEQLIAQHPLAERTQSRLLVVDVARQSLTHTKFSDLPTWLTSSDRLVFNNTKVIPARLFGHKASGGRVEILVERITSPQRAIAFIRASKAPKPNTIVHLENELPCRIVARTRDQYEIEFLSEYAVIDILKQCGHIPLPPYIKRQDGQSDEERYQTVYAKHEGAVAAPTAGLHFDQALLDQLNEKGISKSFVTLHVGAGTFQPVRCENLTDHEMHAEIFDISPQTCDEITATRQQKGRIIAVGTTTVRVLESSIVEDKLIPQQRETSIFIYPPYRFKMVDALITNFHLPESTLLMLVCALGGYEFMMHAYQEAVREQYRFFSYGDAMLILP